MPDITMCHGNSCLLKDQCYRYKAKPTEFQSYFYITPYHVYRDEDGNIQHECEEFWDIKEGN